MRVISVGVVVGCLSTELNGDQKIDKTGGVSSPDDCYSALTVELFDFVEDEEDFTALPAVRLSWFAQGQSVITSSASANVLVMTKMIAMNSFINTPCEITVIQG